MVHITSTFIIISALFSICVKSNESNIKSECQVFNVFVAYVHEIIAVSWTPVDKKCSFQPTYKIQYIVDGNVAETGNSLSTGIPMALFPVGKLKCEGVSVKVLVMENDLIIGQSSENQLQRNLNNITGLSAQRISDGIEVTWQPLNLGRSCIVTYEVRYTVAGSGKEEVVRNLESPRFVIPLTDDSPCVPYGIKVEATSNNLMSPLAEMVYEIGIPPVRDVILENREGEVFVDFKPSIDIPQICGDIEYRVIQKDNDCYLSDFIIVPVSSSGYQGIETNKSIVRQPGPVLDLEAEPKDNRVYLSWKTPIGGTGCNLVYFIKFNGKTFTVHTTHFFAALELEACKLDVVHVIPAVRDGQGYVGGLSSILDLVGDIGPVDEVNCTIKSSMVECWWDKPPNSELCKKMLYDVTYFDGYSKKMERIRDTNFSFRVSYTMCNFWVNVQPIAYVGNKMWEGDVMEAVIAGCEPNSQDNTDSTNKLG